MTTQSERVERGAREEHHAGGAVVEQGEEHLAGGAVVVRLPDARVKHGAGVPKALKVVAEEAALGRGALSRHARAHAQPMRGERRRLEDYKTIPAAVHGRRQPLRDTLLRILVRNPRQPSTHASPRHIVAHPHVVQPQVVGPELLRSPVPLLWALWPAHPTPSVTLIVSLPARAGKPLAPCMTLHHV
jgi:hypothetical protein